MSAESNPARTLTKYITTGLSPTVALDLYMVRDEGMRPETWGRIRGRTGRAVTKSLDRALGELEEFTFEEAEALKNGEAWQK